MKNQINSEKRENNNRLNQKTLTSFQISLSSLQEDLKSSDNLVRVLLIINRLILSGRQIFFVGTNSKYRKILKKVNRLTSQPCYTDKWIGGYLTNCDQIQNKKVLPSILIVLDPKESWMAIQEALLLNIPIISFQETENSQDIPIPSYTSYVLPFQSEERKKKTDNDNMDEKDYSFYPILNSIVKTILKASSRL